MNNTILIIGSYLVVFLLGRLLGVFEAKKTIMKKLKEYGKQS
jgi:uncharacterized protein YneF (UPF0154 family)